MGARVRARRAGRITHFLRYITEFTRYASVVNRENSTYTKFKTQHIHFEWL